DALGNWAVPSRFYQQLREQGVDIRPFKPLSFRWAWSLIRRDHRKLLTVDSEIAFTGGVNIASQWAPEGEGWRDDVLRIEGPAARALERSFRASWRLHFGRAHRRRHELIARGQVALAVLSNRRAIHRAYLHAIERAKTSIVIAAAYFVPDVRLLKALSAAAGRGVR